MVKNENLQIPEEVVVGLENKTPSNLFPFYNKFVIVVEISDHINVSFNVLEKVCKYFLTRKQMNFRNDFFLQFK